MGLRLAKVEVYIETADAAVYGGGSFACGVGLRRPVAAFGGSAGVVPYILRMEGIFAARGHSPTRIRLQIPEWHEALP